MMAVMKLAMAAALLLSVASLALAAVALVRDSDAAPARTVARQPNSPWASYAPLRLPVKLDGLISREQVIAAIGLPDEVFRKNPRAECWAYEGPYTLRLCFGPKRRLAWWSGSIPSDTGG